MEEIFFSTNVSNKCFFQGGVWKTTKRGETFIRHLSYIIVLTVLANGEERLWTCLCISFFQISFLRHLSDTPANKNITYANLIGANPLQKRICESITSAIWKQKETMWSTQVPILNWVDVHPSPIVKSLTWQWWRIYISKIAFLTE